MKPKPKKDDRAALWGTAHSDCDSPLRLYNLTMDWLEKEWADEVDFVICERFMCPPFDHSSDVSNLTRRLIRQGRAIMPGMTTMQPIPGHRRRYTN